MRAVEKVKIRQGPWLQKQLNNQNFYPVDKFWDVVIYKIRLFLFFSDLSKCERVGNKIYLVIFR